MILYRVQAINPEAGEWSTVWVSTQAIAKQTAKDFDTETYEVKIDKIDIPSGRDGLVLALNHAEVNRINWPGEEV